jgi:hypothetical protein
LVQTAKGSGENWKGQSNKLTTGEGYTLSFSSGHTSNDEPE